MSRWVCCCTNRCSTGGSSSIVAATGHARALLAALHTPPLPLLLRLYPLPLPPSNTHTHMPQVALDRAAELLDLVAAGEGSYADVVTPLADAYAAAGLHDVAEFIRAAAP